MILNIKKVFFNFFLLTCCAESFSIDLLSAQEIKPVVRPENTKQYSELLLEPVTDLIDRSLLEIEIDQQLAKGDLEGSLEIEALSFLILNKFQTDDLAKGKNSALLTKFIYADDQLKENKSLSLQVISPPPLKDLTYSALVFPVDLKVKNKFLINSPINSCREINFENTEDEIFSGPITFSDMFQDHLTASGWDIENVASKNLLVPASFKGEAIDQISLDKINLEKEEILKYYKEINCELKPDKEVLQTNTLDRKFVQSNRRIKILASERNVNIIKRRPTNPFTSVGFEIIALDKIGNLPRIKLTYDTKLKFVKGVFYFWKKSVVGGVNKLVLEGVLAFDKDMRELGEVGHLVTYEGFNKECIKEKLKALCPVKEADRASN